MNKKTKKYSKKEILKMDNLFNLVDLPDENRTGVMKVVNPVDWSVVRFDLSEFTGKTVSVKFYADVKREGASGSLTWQINNKNFPAVGMRVYNAKTDIWHKTGGEWTGVLTDSQPVIYLNTWKNDSERTTFYIDNITLEIVFKS
ncbi:MAG: hypothetical protein FWD48_07695 [Oscillospiraceae bacterium]|nr:hypothetical protein [Oscillospiraceae bacterium]